MIATVFVMAVIVCHFLFHLFGLFGVIWGIWHSDRVHGHKRWKVVLGLVWTLISILAMMDGIKEVVSCHS
jgi:hypothetical protein